MTLFVSTAAHAETPRWVSNLTTHAAMQEVHPAQREEVACLALAIYFEARGESAKGQQAVGNVVMNRMRSGRYPSTACGVLFQRGQFSFIRRGTPSVPKTPRLWESAIRMAHSVLIGRAGDVSGGALSFCQRRLRKSGLITIGGHTFY